MNECLSRAGRQQQEKLQKKTEKLMFSKIADESKVKKLLLNKIEKITLKLRYRILFGIYGCYFNTKKYEEL